MRLHNIIHPREVTEFVYRYARAEVAHVFISFIVDRTKRVNEVAEIIRELEKEGMKPKDISDDELAKAHGRYLVGGCQTVEHERVFRFGKCVCVCGPFKRAQFNMDDRVRGVEFPERPGALRRFLHELRSDWNISLFHYRNHGAGMSSPIAQL